MPSSHCHLLGMQLQEWDLYVPAILTKLYSIHDILQPACETGSFLTHWMPAQGISSTKPQKPPHLCLPSLGGGRILVQRLTHHLVSNPVSVTECPLPVTSKSFLYPHYAPRLSGLPVKQAFSISSCNPLLLNFRQLLLHLHPFVFPKLLRHHLHPRPPV